MRTNKLRLAVGSATILGGGLVAGALLSGGGAVAADPTDPAAPAATASECGGPGAPGGHDHTPVTGAELTEVTEAVEAHDDAITVESVREDPDGSYDVHGTKDGEPVALEVSADLATITERTGGPGPGHRGGPGGERPAAAPSEGTTTTPSAYVRA
ncbi:MAG: hypothetical protein JWN84_1392 [Nocardioides sp.]|jgi:hypothetical protein|nr:hypothetical protein [Nocardioides sp.]